MRIDILTVVPELLTSPLNESILHRAQEKGLVQIVVHNLHDYAHDRRKTTDDYPFGGEAGMVLKCEPVFELVEKLQSERHYDEIIYTSPDEFRRRNGLDGRPIVALLAGSRRGEIRDNLPLMADLSKKFPGHQFVVAGVSWLDRALYEQYMAGSDIRYVCDQTYETLAAAEAAVVTSGTATLETALLGIPEVVVYRTLWFQVKLQPYVLNVPWVSLVNLNLGREAVAEIIQSGLDITRAERELRAVVEGGSKREKMLSDFDELRKVIGGPGASDRFAARMVAELHATEAQ